MVWADAIDYYCLTVQIFTAFPYDLNRVAYNQIASVDSIHRNIAEGYCRRSINEYLNFLMNAARFCHPANLCPIQSSTLPPFHFRMQS